MKNEQLEQLRHVSRKLVRELGLLELDQSDSSHASPGHWHALIEIDKDPGITISKLSYLLIVSISKMSRLIKSLVKEGLVELKAGPDKREKYLYLTTSGKNAIKEIDAFSRLKIEGAFEFLKKGEMLKITESIKKYSDALEKSRLLKTQVKIATLSTSRTIRKQIAGMIANIQKGEFLIPITDETNQCVLKAEQYFYYDHSYNFWYATDKDGKIIGSIGLKKMDSKNAEIKKFFVIPEYRGKGVAQKLMCALSYAAVEHGFKSLYLGTVDKLHAAHKFYENYGFKRIDRNGLPDNFEICVLDSVFFQCEATDLAAKFD